MNSQSPDTVPTSTGRRFMIHACLGRGGFGEVYRATMSSSGGVRTEVAIKVLRADIDPGSEAVKRLRDEGRLLGALRHPAILRVHDLVLLENRVALVTEFVEGEDLDKCMATEPPLPRRALMGALGEVAAALDAAWNSPSPTGTEPIHLIHRDVKPANIRIGRHGEVKLLDFGIAHATNVTREAHTANNAMMGSYLYMAPERFHEEKVEPPSDIYALGCILFEGLTHHRLFEGMTLKQIYGTMLLSRKFNAHLDERMKLLPTDLEEPILTLLRETLDVDASRRPTAQHVARRSEDIVENMQGSTLKRWARSREWSAQQVIAGTLDGRDLSAQSFGASEGGLFQDATPAEDTFVHPIEPPPEEPKPFVAAPLPSAHGPLAGRGDARSMGLGPMALPPLGMPIFGGGGGYPGNAGLGPNQGPTRQQAIEAPPRRPSVVPIPIHDEPPAAAVPKVPTPAPAPVRAPEPEMTAPALYEAEPGVPDEVSGATAVPLAQNDTPVRYARSVTPAPTPAAQPPQPPHVASVKPKTEQPPAARMSAPRETAGEPAVFVGIAPEPTMEPIPGVLFEDRAQPALRDDEFEAQLRSMQSRSRRRNVMIAILSMTLVGLLALVGIGYLSVLSLGGGTGGGRGPDGGLVAKDAAPVPDPVVPPTPDPAPAPVAPTKVAPGPAPAPVEPAAPKPPTPEPAPAPAAKKPSQLVDAGWNVVEGNPTKALDLFGQAKTAGGGAEASYGYGYALMKLGRNDEATTALCGAIAAGDESLKREVRSVMERKGLTCP